MLAAGPLSYKSLANWIVFVSCRCAGRVFVDDHVCDLFVCDLS